MSNEPAWPASHGPASWPLLPPALLAGDEAKGRRLRKCLKSKSTMLDPGADHFKHAPYNEIVCIKNNDMK